jgi:aquaporin Z
MMSSFVTEFVMTFMFIIIFGATEKDRAREAFAGVAIELALTLIHLIIIPVTETSVNPAPQYQSSNFRTRLGITASVVVYRSTNFRRYNRRRCL